MSVEAHPIGEWEGASVGAWRARWGVGELHLFGRVGSTNDVLRRRAEAGAPSGAVALADEQTAGRGRAGKPWLAPAGTGLLLSILLRPRRERVPDTTPGSAPLRVGLAVARAIERVAGTRIGLKWPNDILIEGAGKLGGILCEGVLDASSESYIIAGIGVNVSQRADAWPAGLQSRATSLLLVTGRTIARAALAGAIIDELLGLADAVTAPLSDRVLCELTARDVLRGHRVTVDGCPRGIAAGIARDGALVVRDAGVETHLRSGTVRLADAAEPAAQSPRP